MKSLSMFKDVFLRNFNQYAWCVKLMLRLWLLMNFYADNYSANILLLKWIYTHYIYIKCDSLIYGLQILSRNSRKQNKAPFLYNYFDY